MKRFSKMIAWMAFPLLAFIVAAPGASAQTTVAISEDNIDIRINYNGSTVNVSGNTENDVDLVIRIDSEYIDEKMMVKDKVGGLLWMNSGKVEFQNVPNLYYLKSSAEVTKILDPGEQKEYGIGYEALAANAVIEPPVEPGKAKTLFADFIRYKEQGKLYSQTVGGVEMEADGNGQSYRAAFEWPYQAPPDDYVITVYAVRDGRVIDSAETGLVVKEVGVEKALTELAQEKGGLYGIAAIIVALAAGLGVGVIFKTGGGAH